MSERKYWDVNDYAFLVYATRKGVKFGQIADAMKLPKAAVYAQSMRVNHPERYSRKVKDMVHKAEVMAQEVLSGVFPDTRSMWDEKIAKVSGLHFTYNDLRTVLPEKLPIIEISVNTGSLISIIKFIKQELL